VIEIDPDEHYVRLDDNEQDDVLPPVYEHLTEQVVQYDSPIPYAKNGNFETELTFVRRGKKPRRTLPSQVLPA